MVHYEASQVLDLHKCAEVLQDTHNNSPNFKGLDCVMAFGTTGAGKTTTLLKLCGKNLILVKNTIVVENPSSDDIGAIGTKTHSETRGVKLKEANGISFIDTGGILDTEGPSVDLANICTFIQTLRDLNSVVPILVISYPIIMESKGKLLLPILEFYAGLFSNDSECINKTFFFLTRGPEEFDKEELSDYIEQLLEESHVSDGAKIVLEAFFDAMDDNKVVNFNPLAKLDKRMLRRLKDKKNRITDTKFLQLSLPSYLSNELNAKLREMKETVLASAQNNEIQTIKNTLILFEVLSERLEPVKETFHLCKKLLNNLVLEKQSATIARFLECLQNSNHWNEGDVQKINELLKLLKNMESVQRFLTDDVKTAEAVEAVVWSQCNELLTRTSEENDFIALKNYQQKFQQLSRTLVLPSYNLNTLVEKFQACLVTKIETIKDALTKFAFPQTTSLETIGNAFVDLYNYVLQVRLAKLQFGGSLDIPFDEIEKDTIQEIEKNFENIVETISQSVKTISPVTLNELQQKIFLLKAAKNNMNLIELLGSAFLSKNWTCAITICVEEGKKIATQLETIDASSAGATKNKLEPVKLLGTLDVEIQAALNPIMFNLMNKLSSSVERNLISFQDELEKEKPDFTRIAQFYKTMKKFIWMDEFPSNLGRIQLALDEATEILLSILQGDKLSMERFWKGRRYAKLFELLDRLQSMEVLGNLNLDLKKEIEEMSGFFENGLDEFFNNITESCKKSTYTPLNLPDDQEDKEGLSFFEIGKKFRQLDALQDIARISGRLDSHEEIIEEISDFIEKKSKALISKVENNPTDFGIHAAVLDALEPLFKNKFIPEDCKVHHTRLKNRVTAHYEELYNSCVNDIENDLIDDAQQKLLLISKSRALSSIKSMNNIDFLERTKILEKKLTETNKAKLEMIPRLIESRNYNIISHLIHGLPEDSKQRKDAIQTITSIVEDKQVKLLVEAKTFRPITTENTFNSTKFQEISGNISFFEACFLNFTFISWQKDTLRQIYQTLDNSIAQCVDENLFNLFKNKYFDNAISLEKQLRTAANYLGDNIPNTNKNLQKYKKVVVEYEEDLKNSNIFDLHNSYESIYQQSGQNYLKTLIERIVRNLSLQRSKEIELETDSRKVSDLVTEFEIDINGLGPNLKSITLPFLEKAKRTLQTRSSQKRDEFAKSLSDDPQRSFEIYEELRKNSNTEAISNCDHLLRETRKSIANILSTSISREDYESVSKYIRRYNSFANHFPKIYGPLDDTDAFGKLKRKVNDLTRVVERCSSFTINSDFPNEYFSSVITLLNITNIKNMDIVSGREITNAIKPIDTILTEIDEYVVKGIAQYNFRFLHHACKVSRKFSTLIENLQKLHLEHQSFVLLKHKIERAETIDSLSRKITGFLQTVGDEIRKSWETNKDCIPMEKVLRSINVGELNELGRYVQDTDSYSKEIKSIAEELYLKTFNAAEKTLELSSPDFNQCYSDLKKLETVENHLGKNGSAEIETKVIGAVDNLAQMAKQSNDIPSLSTTLISIQKIADEIPMIEEKVSKAISSILDEEFENVDKIADQLKDRQSRLGNIMIQKYSHFAAAKRDRWIQKTSGINIETAVDNFKISEDFSGQSISEKLKKVGQMFAIIQKDKTALISEYKRFEKEFREKVESNKINPDYDAILAETKKLCEKRTFGSRYKILANVLAVWSLTKSNVNMNSRSKGQSREFWYQPHAVQVLTLFRMLDQKSNRFINQLVQILTGEGKSVVLGTLSTVFALCDMDVNCICYSNYLSKRDYKDFYSVFEKFKVVDRIRYSTIAEMCEHIINRNGNIRDLTNSFLQNQNEARKNDTNSVPRKSVLLIDEVDVFFGADFYGDTYNPATKISNEHTFELMKFIWKNQSTNLQTIQSTPSYQSIVTLYPEWEKLIQSEISKMLVQVKEYKDHNPVAIDNRIAYAIHGDTSFNTAYGYETAFAYFYFHDRGDITEESVRNYVGIHIICGNFSYAKIPKMADYILGVSGTLSNLTDVEKQILIQYGIERVGEAPSMYKRENNLSITGVSYIEGRDDWFLKITQNAKNKIENGQAVIVIFEKEETMGEYISSKKGQFENFQVLEEKTEFKSNIIQRATMSKMVTAVARVFARGSDFSCQDSATTAAGGVHVIMTFVAESAAESIQAKGRTARQGEPGSFEMLLWKEDLINLGLTSEQLAEASNKGILPQLIDKTRDDAYSQMVAGLIQGELDATKQHELTMDFHKKLLSYDSSPQMKDDIQKIIFQLNIPPSSNASSANYHIYFCLDDSGSMSGNWGSLVNAVTAFVGRRIEMCEKSHSTPSDKVTIVNYSSNAQLMCHDIDIKSCPTSIQYRGGGTNFAAGLNMVYERMKSCAQDLQPVLVFMSDGGSSSGDAEIKKIAQDFSSKNIDIFLLGFGNSCNSQKLKNMAKISQGQYFFGADGAALKAEFVAISTQISSKAVSL